MYLFVYVHCVLKNVRTMLFAIYYLVATFLTVRHLVRRNDPLADNNDNKMDASVKHLIPSFIYDTLNVLVEQEQRGMVYIMVYGGFFFLVMISVGFMLAMKKMWLLSHPGSESVSLCGSLECIWEEKLYSSLLSSSSTLCFCS